MIFAEFLHFHLTSPFFSLLSNFLPSFFFFFFLFLLFVSTLIQQKIISFGTIFFFFFLRLYISNFKLVTTIVYKWFGIQVGRRIFKYVFSLNDRQIYIKAKKKKKCKEKIGNKQEKIVCTMMKKMVTNYFVIRITFLLKVFCPNFFF